MDKSVLTVELPSDLDDSLKAEAKARLTSKSAVVREILQAHVKQVHLARPELPQPTQPQEVAA